MITRRHLGLTGAAAFGLAACGKQASSEAPGELTFSILPTAPAASLLKNWQPVLDDMAKATGLKIKPFIPSNYTVLIEAMRFKQTDAGWFSNESGLEAVRRANGEVFARTLGPGGVNGYQSLLIVNAKSDITLDRIKKCDRTLSFGQADAISTSGTSPRWPSFSAPTTSSRRSASPPCAPATTTPTCWPSPAARSTSPPTTPPP